MMTKKILNGLDFFPELCEDNPNVPVISLYHGPFMENEVDTIGMVDVKNIVLGRNKKVRSKIVVFYVKGHGYIINFEQTK